MQQIKIQPEHWRHFLRAVAGSDGDPAIVSVGDHPASGIVQYVVTINPYEVFLMTQRDSDLEIVFMRRGEIVSGWRSDPNAFQRNLVAFQSGGLLELRLPLSPITTIEYIPVNPPPRRPGSPYRKQRIVVCRDGRLVLVLSESRLISVAPREEEITYSLSEYPDQNWFEFCILDRGAGGADVKREPERRSLPIFEGDGGLRP